MYWVFLSFTRACICASYMYLMDTVVNPRHACAARVTVLGLSVCMSACLTLILELQATKRHASGTLVLYKHNKHSKNNVADSAKMAALWQEKPAQPWTKFRDPTHQLAQCTC